MELFSQIRTPAQALEFASSREPGIERKKNIYSEKTTLFHKPRHHHFTNHHFHKSRNLTYDRFQLINAIRHSNQSQNFLLSFSITEVKSSIRKLRRSRKWFFQRNNEQPSNPNGTVLRDKNCARFRICLLAPYRKAKTYSEITIPTGIEKSHWFPTVPKNSQNLQHRYPPNTNNVKMRRPIYP